MTQPNVLSAILSTVNTIDDSSTLISLFRQQVALTPDNTALVFEGETLSYQELDALSERLAEDLHQYNIGREDKIGLCLSRGLSVVIGIIAILKSGAAYVPIDPSSPIQRAQFIIQDSGLQLIIHDSWKPEALEQWQGPAISFSSYQQWELTGERLKNDSPDSTKPKPPLVANNLAYIIYTSGSTGKPKGALVEHRQVVRLLTTCSELFDFSDKDVWTLFHSVAFDFSVWEIWGALLFGGTLVIPSYDVCRSPEDFIQLLIQHKVTVLNKTPSAFRQLIDADSQQAKQLNHLRYIIFGGEKLDTRQLKPWVKRYPLGQPKLINMYGITETTVHVTFFEVDKASLDCDDSRIGKPLPDLTITLVDDNLEKVESGSVGEMLITGPGVVRGYLNRPELNSERFIEFTLNAQPEKAYLSGDLARQEADGNFVYLGRKDTQVKLRGFRIELGEIEHTLASHPQVQDAVVKVCDTVGGEQKLAAYIVPSTSPAVSDDAVDESVNLWRDIFNATYTEGAEDAKTDSDDNSAFNISGWKSSYTSDMIPSEEMGSWLDNTVERILSYKPKHVLEIGCGTGMILHGIASQLDSYTGIDLSDIVIELLQEQVARGQFPDLAITLKTGQATDKDLVPLHSVDMVIINSVSQFFMQPDYLNSVLDQAVRYLKPGGVFFFGDVRNFDLLPHFHASISTFKASGDTTLKHLRDTTSIKVTREEELTISPSYFYAYGLQHADVNDVHIFVRQDPYVNELTKFRFDAVMTVSADSQSASQATDTQKVITQEYASVAQNIEKVLSEIPDNSQLLITNIPNQRISYESALITTFDTAPTGTKNSFETPALNEHNALELPYNSSVLAQYPELQFDWLHMPDHNNGYLSVLIRKQNQLLPNLLQAAHLRHSLAPEWDRYLNKPLLAIATRHIIPQLKPYLADRLPDYMLPAAIVPIDKVPLTINGKVDKTNLPEPNWNVNTTRAEYVAPRNQQEQSLSDIWSQVLGIDKVGINDNFFDLGGDSILTTQIIVKAKAANIQVSALQLFKNNTIAELSEVIGKQTTAIVAEQGQVSGAQCLTAIQHWIIERSPEALEHANLFTLLKTQKPIDVATLKQAVERLIDYHDGLRLSFKRQNNVWHSSYQKLDIDDVFSVCELSGIAKEERENFIQHKVVQTNASLSIDNNKLVKFIVFNAEKGEQQHLLFVVHQLIIDGSSTRLLIENLASIYETLTAGETPALVKTSSAQYYGKKLETLAKRSQDLAFWKRQLKTVPALPKDNAIAKNLEAEACDFVATLDDNETEDLLKRVPNHFRARIQEVLLAALVISLKKWTQESRFKIELESHGRQPIFEDVDLSSTVGCFTAIYPLIIASPNTDIADNINLVKSLNRSLPEHGISHGLLHYVNDASRSALHDSNPPEILFNYLGQFDQLIENQSLFSLAGFVNKSSRAPVDQRTHIFEINSYVYQGKYQLCWTYSSQMYKEESIATLANCYMDVLREIIQQCSSLTQARYVPADFPLVSIKQSTIDTITDSIPNIEAIVPLTPLQEGMLHHTELNPGTGNYYIQQRLSLKRTIDVNIMQQVWQSMLNQHDILRAAYWCDSEDQALQVISSQAQLHFYDFDHSDASAEQRLQILAEWQGKRAYGYTPKTPSQMSVILLQFAPDHFEMIWNFHHILLDGHSMTALTNKVMTQYNQRENSSSSSSDTTDNHHPGFADFIRWQQQKDKTEGMAYWKEQIGSFSSTVKLPQEKSLAPDSENDKGFESDRHEKLLYQCPESLTQALGALARDARLTINTVIEGLWGLLLSHWSAQDDILFGAVVPGRSSEIEGVENIVGLLMSTLPVRIDFQAKQTMLELLQQHQLTQVEHRQYEYCPLADLKQLTQLALEQPLLSSVISVQGYLGEHGSLEEWAQSLGVDQYHLIDWNDFPLSVAVEVGQTMGVLIKYDTHRYEKFSINNMFEDLENGIKTLLNDIHITTDALKQAIAKHAQERTLIGAKSAKQKKLKGLRSRKRS